MSNILQAEGSFAGWNYYFFIEIERDQISLLTRAAENINHHPFDGPIIKILDPMEGKKEKLTVPIQFKSQQAFFELAKSFGMFLQKVNNS